MNRQPFMRHLIRFLLVFLLMRLSSPLFSAEETQTQSAPHSDVRLNHQIHSAIVDDATLPYCAHIVKVQSKNGKVTLQGKVYTEAQKTDCGEKAAAIVGEENVTNEIVVSGS